MDRYCELCGSHFEIYPCWDKPGWQRYCSRDCKKGAIKSLHATPLTVEYLKSVLNYCPETGVFRWRVHLGRHTANSIAGTVKSKPKNYRTIEIRGKPYAAHRLAWFYMTGAWPKDQIDHIDRDKENNAWSNLREATNSQNKANSKLKTIKNAELRGVHKMGNRFAAYIGSPPKYLGMYATEEEAHAAYLLEARERFGEFFIEDHEF